MAAELNSNLNYLLIQFVAKLVIGLLLGFFLGRTRAIGMAWTTFFSVTCWPLGALIFVLMSPKVKDTEITASRSKKIIGSVVLILGIVLCLGISMALLDNAATRNHPILLYTLVFGLIGGGIYLILRGTGISFHQRTKLDIADGEPR